MIAAAWKPWPTTSPMAIPSRPSGSAKASYQSPPSRAAAAGQVAAGERDRRQLGEAGEEAALERVREAALALGEPAEDRERGAVSGALEQLGVIRVEGALRERSHVQHPEHRPLHEQGTPSSERSPRSRRSGFTTSASSRFRMCTGWRVAAMRPAKPRPDRDPDPRSTSSSSPFAARATSVVSSSSSSRTAAVSTPRIVHHAREQLVEQGLERQVRERGIRDALEITEAIGGNARPHGGDCGASYGSSRSRTASLKPASAARRWNA